MVMYSPEVGASRRKLLAIERGHRQEARTDRADRESGARARCDLDCLLTRAVTCQKARVASRNTDENLRQSVDYDSRRVRLWLGLPGRALSCTRAVSSVGASQVAEPRTGTGSARTCADVPQTSTWLGPSRRPRQPGGTLRRRRNTVFYGDRVRPSDALREIQQAATWFVAEREVKALGELTAGDEHALDPSSRRPSGAQATRAESRGRMPFAPVFAFSVTLGRKPKTEKNRRLVDRQRHAQRSRRGNPAGLLTGSQDTRESLEEM
jgi:hypothetical protein